MSFDPWHVTRSPPIEKKFRVGKYNKPNLTTLTNRKTCRKSSELLNRNAKLMHAASAKCGKMSSSESRILLVFV